MAVAGSCLAELRCNNRMFCMEGVLCEGALVMSILGKEPINGRPPLAVSPLYLLCDCPPPLNTEILDVLLSGMTTTTVPAH